MRQTIGILLMAALTVWTFGPAVVGASGNGIITEFTFVAGDDGAPIIKAKWETPDSADPNHQTAGTQLMPIGQWEQWTDYEVCAVATDPNGVADIFGVYAEIYYPDEYPGCGVKIEKNQLVEMGHTEGIAAFEDAYTKGLVHLNSPYDYAEIMWELNDAEAKVYCHEKQLWYEWPHGDYTISVHAVDKGGVQSVYLENFLKYVALTNFEVDFSNVDYGDVKLDTEQIHSGDTVWEPPYSDRPTVRNIGNTWLKLKVWQDDMGLGKTGDNWNVKYDIRLGPKVDESDSTKKYYYPEAWSAWLPNPLKLSVMEKLDFSIRVYQATPDDIYIGTMLLEAKYVPFSGCCEPCP